MKPQLLANAIRMLSVDAIQKANSGHPGAPMGMADIAEVVWRHHLRHNPKDPQWFNRDRYVQSNGHGSMLLYSLLHLTGYDVTMDDIRDFRQLHSRTPGHPEYGYTPGVETTTGPLGQGVANAVGMAIAEKALAAQFNKPGFDIVDHHTWLFLGDGCLMEGISHEACGLAGTLKLGNLIAVWDDNGISIDGHVEGWFSEDTAARFRAYGWHVIEGIDGHNPEAVDAAVREAKAVTDKPSLLCCKTIIGFGSPNKADSHECHGSALGADEVALVRERLEWPYAPFEIPAAIYDAWDATAKGSADQKQWEELFAAYSKEWPELASEFVRRMKGDLPTGWEEDMKKYILNLQAHPAALATRQVSQKCLNHFGNMLPELMGGSADLSPSNLTRFQKSVDFTAEHPEGNYISYGVREFGMSAIMNGLALHGGFIPYGGTFLMFMEYARNAVRMAALMKIRSVFVYTHDTIGLGEDGPTHQPVEQLASLRLTPNMETWRGCDQVEVSVAWQQAVERKDGPSALVLTRQPLEQQPRTATQLEEIARGGYILSDCEGKPELILISAGSEIELVVSAAKILRQEGRQVRVVSMPCTERFDKQDEAWQETVLPKDVRKRLAVEASIAGFWQRYTGLDGKVIGMTTFGESAPAGILFDHFGFTKDNVLEHARALLQS
ncbi:transketolase [Salmonella enterica subsp. enterica]|uniref:Transketolase n=1 Tax=Salmonella enterica subsp. enterica serovar Napoli TaxID=1151001 RepID=A0A5I0KQ36_SALET|nr:MULTISPECIES: transketolase [Enterobacteriaceae]EAA4072548.1 transketolase [Salmonella enterica subsp. enterica serovar Napoli]EAC0523923.1 transketolase [Salmonella enterica subsp. enterica serovar Zaiman]EAU6663355.1 transketolase [Salmonella enterica]ECF7023422.1 transketolase [Salmonella enterica subsp. enterica]ECY8074003.1 transketolase [Salmonella enterica subsp. enterica serovar Vitkin]EDW4663057.1 transketolase [Salmonella enterica subsp. enterica serovar Bonn]EEN5244682.1 transk